MRIKAIERFRYKISGRSVPVVKVDDINEAGEVRTIQLLGNCGKRANSIISPWDQKTWEIDPSVGCIRLIDEKGIESQAYVVSPSGSTVPLCTRYCAYPNLEDIQGKASTMDDIADSMDLHKSFKQMAIGMLVGIPLGIFILGPMFTTMLS